MNHGGSFLVARTQRVLGDLQVSIAGRQSVQHRVGIHFAPSRLISHNLPKRHLLAAFSNSNPGQTAHAPRLVSLACLKLCTAARLPSHRCHALLRARRHAVLPFGEKPPRIDVWVHRTRSQHCSIASTQSPRTRPHMARLSLGQRHSVAYLNLVLCRAVVP